MYSNRGWSYSPKPSSPRGRGVKRPFAFLRFPRLLRTRSSPVAIDASSNASPARDSLIASTGLEAAGASERGEQGAVRPKRWRRPALPAFSPLPFAIALVGAAAWYHFAFAGFSLHGKVVDGTTGQPIAGARVWSARASAIASTDGSFILDRVRPPDALGVDAPGYRAQDLRIMDPFQAIAPHLDPIGVEVEAIDAETEQPVPALLDAPPTSASITPIADGRIRIAPIRPGQLLSFSAAGYLPAQAAYAGQDVLRIPMQPRLDGRITDAQTGKPISDARVSIGDT